MLLLVDAQLVSKNKVVKINNSFVLKCFFIMGSLLISILSRAEKIKGFSPFIKGGLDCDVAYL